MRVSSTSLPASSSRAIRSDAPFVVIGAGPAGLTAAYALARSGRPVVVLEASPRLGGIARTESYRGFRFDIGGHRFFTKEARVQALWEEMLGEDFLRVRRLSRIYYDGRFFDYPLRPLDVVAKLGVGRSLLLTASYLRSLASPRRPEETFEDWVVNRFGWRLYMTFFKEYTEKVWGLPCSEIRAEWAAQRIQGLSFTKMLTGAIIGNNGSRSLIEEFSYPRLGPGMMWQRFADAVAAEGGRIELETEVVEVRCRGGAVSSVLTRSPRGLEEIDCAHLISSMPLNHLVLRLRPCVPAPVADAARNLRHRAFILVGLLLNRRHLFADNWIYVHSPDVRVGRIQNFKNWSADMVPDPAMTSLGMEYFCDVGDDVWRQGDASLIALAARELVGLGLADDADVDDGVVFREPRAYPVYDAAYARNVAALSAHLEGYRNLATIGRNGLHRYNNQDHSMITALLAVENLGGGDHDLWGVNTERSYHERLVRT